MVRHMQDTGTGIVLIASHKVIFGTDRHIRGRNRDILVTGNIHACRIVHLIVSARSNRITRNIPFSMIENGVYIGRKYRLIGIIYGNCRVGPPKEGLWNRSRIIQFSLYLQYCTSRTQGKTGHPFLMEHPFAFAYPNDGTSIGTTFDRIVDRQERTRTVMLRPVKFNTTGDPRSGQSDQSGFDNMVIVDEMAVFNLIVRHLYPSAQLGKDHHFYIFVFQPNSMVTLFLAGILYLFNHRIRVNHTTASLVNTLLQEHRILFSFANTVGRKKDIFFPNFHIFSHFSIFISLILFPVPLKFYLLFQEVSHG